MVAEAASNINDPAGIPELFSYANYYAILIGEKDYEDPGFNDLESPAKDVSDLKKILTKYYQFIDKEVKTLINSPRVNILDSITAKAESMKDDDNLIIFYAGHGDVKKLGTKILGGYIILSDAKKNSRGTYISSEDLKSSIEGSEAKHILFVVDACLGGALFRGTMDEAPQNIKNLYNQKSRKMITRGNMEEVPDNGSFIQRLKDYLTNNTQKYFSAYDLFTTLFKTADISTPQYEAISGIGDMDGQFIFVKK
ncbi:MAG: caspase family protein [Parafilimonas sp.]